MYMYYKYWYWKYWWNSSRQCVMRWSIWGKDFLDSRSWMSNASPSPHVERWESSPVYLVTLCILRRWSTSSSPLANKLTRRNESAKQPRQLVARLSHSLGKTVQTSGFIYSSLRTTGDSIALREISSFQIIIFSFFFCSATFWVEKRKFLKKLVLNKRCNGMKLTINQVFQFNKC